MRTKTKTTQLHILLSTEQKALIERAARERDVSASALAREGALHLAKLILSAAVLALLAACSGASTAPLDISDPPPDAARADAKPSDAGHKEEPKPTLPVDAGCLPDGEACGAGDYCVEGVCRGGRGVGSTCTATWGCAEGGYCQIKSGSDEGVCLEDVELGASCGGQSGPQCAPAYVCDDGVCKFTKGDFAD